MRKHVNWVGLVALSLAAGYGVYETMPSGYPLRGSPGAIPGWSEPARAAAGVGVALLVAAVAAGLRRVVRSQPDAERGLVVVAWAGWAMVGSLTAVGASLWLSLYTLNTRGYFTFTDWAVVRGLLVGVVWAGVVLAGVSAWRRSRTPNQALQQTAGA
jgi:hypothetical protein